MNPYEGMPIKTTTIVASPVPWELPAMYCGDFPKPTEEEAARFAKLVDEDFIQFRDALFDAAMKSLGIPPSLAGEDITEPIEVTG